MFGDGVRAAGAVIVVAVLVGVAVFVFWPQGVDVPSRDPAGTTVATSAAAVTTTTGVQPVVSPAPATTVAAAQIVESEGAGSPPATGGEPGGPESAAPASTVPEPEVVVSPLPASPPSFNEITPTHRWGEDVSGSGTGNVSQALDVWYRVAGFWDWYMTEGHPMAHGFDAATRPGLSERACGADQLGSSPFLVRDAAYLGSGMERRVGTGTRTAAGVADDRLLARRPVRVQQPEP